MKLKIYQVDAFTSEAFGGNPAAVCPLESWISDSLMQSIALENNLSETAFLVKSKEHYSIRWFTPATEIDLCGHATLASAHVLFQQMEPGAAQVAFQSRKHGMLYVYREKDLLTLDFPASPASPNEITPEITDAFGEGVTEVYTARDLMVVMESEQKVRDFLPDFQKIGKLHPHAVMITSPGDQCDFVSRFFAPNVGIPEDPVTGSAHTALIPFWAKKLNKTYLTARQLSKRGGELVCEWKDERVLIGGRAVTYMEGTILLP